MTIMTLSAPLTPVPISAAIAPASVTWEGKSVDLSGKAAYVNTNGKIMIPLRVVAEAMGYKVNWLGESRTVELTRGAHWVTLKAGQDWYCFGKMAPETLGAASEIKNGSTYVPMSFFSDVLPFAASVNDKGTLEIATSAVATEPVATTGPAITPAPGTTTGSSIQPGPATTTTPAASKIKAPY